MTLVSKTLRFRESIALIVQWHASDHIGRAQIEALKSRVPYLYIILIINVLALSYTHQPTNPFWQVTLLPAALTLVITIRIIWWARLVVHTLSDRDITKLRQSTIRLSGVMGVFILGWALSLHYTDGSVTWSNHMSQSGHVDFFVGVTAISCIFLLMHLRMAAILVASIVMVPFCMCLLASGRTIETAIALNLLLVTGAMLYVTISFSRDFERMVSSALELRRLNVRNSEIALSDVLTGLPNRRQFFEELTRAGQSGSMFAVIALDLDGFKQINDVYGHNGGDLVLQGVAARLRDILPPGVCLARLGGDEFACLMTGEHATDADEFAASLIKVCSTPISFPLFSAKVGASAGTCTSSSHSQDALGVYERADYALFEAKRHGRNRVEKFSMKHDRSMRRDSSIAQLLRSSKLDDELSVAYQPIYDAKTLDVTSFEALVRWTSPELGPVGPSEFIAVAERTDLIFELSRYILRTSLREAASWPETIGVKVNLSIRDLMSRPQSEALVAVLQGSGVRPSRVTFEVTETIFAESIEVVKSNVAVLRSTGCKIAIDDFGIAYSSLNYIHVLAPDTIKIDRCFVEAVGKNDVNKRIIRTIIELARNVGARTVAEGVETSAQVCLLTELGCDDLQGYYLSRPVSAAAALILANESGQKKHLAVRHQIIAA